MENQKIVIKGIIILVSLIFGFLLWKQIQYQLSAKSMEELKLSDLPESFKCNTLIVVGDNASEIELQAVTDIDNYLQSKTRNNLIWKENTENKQIDNANFSIKAKKYSSTLTITNTGDVVLTNIRIIKDRDFTSEGVIMHKKIIKVIPKLHVNESVNISIPEISSCGFLPEEENITASNEGWIIVTCDQGVTKKIVFCEVIPHTIKRRPTHLEFLHFIFFLLS